MPLATLACGLCPPTPKAEATSPSGDYVARSSSFACGPVPPYNERVELQRRTDTEFDEVVKIVDAPFSASVNWTGAKTLQITIDCQFTTASECGVPVESRVTLQMKKRWRDVQLEYLVGPRLRSFGAGDVLERFGSSYWW
jgi:hypothetical protein